MGRKNTNFRKLYLVDENHYNSLQYGQVHDRHLKDVKSLYETLNRPQLPPTQNAPPQQQDPPMNADPQNMSSTSDVSMQTLSSPSNVAAPQPPQPPPQSTTTNNPVPFPGFLQNAQQSSPLGAAIQQIPTIPYLNYGPPLLPRPTSGQPNQNNALQVSGFVGPTQSILSPQPIVQFPPSPPQPTAPNPLQFSGYRQPTASAPSIPAMNFGGLSPISAIQPLSQPTSVLRQVGALPAPPAPLALPAPAAPLALSAPAGTFASAGPAELGMQVDPSRGTRRARSPDTVGDNGSPIIGRPSRRRHYQSVIQPVPTVASALSEPTISQQVVAPTNILPSARGRRARSDADSSSTIDGRTVRRRTDESPIRSRSPQPTVANGSQDLGARRRTYQRVLIDPDEDFLRQNSRDTRQQRSEIEWLTCPICKISFRSDQSLRKHIERIHKEYLEQTEKGEKRDRGDQEYGRVDKKYKRIA